MVDFLRTLIVILLLTVFYFGCYYVSGMVRSYDWSYYWLYACVLAGATVICCRSIAATHRNKP